LWTGVEVELPGVGQLTSCRCPEPCGALVTFPVEETIFCPVCVEQVLQADVDEAGEYLVNVYSRGAGRGSAPEPSAEPSDVESSFLARHEDDAPQTLDGFEDGATDFSGMLQIKSNDPAARTLQLPLALALQAPKLRVEPPALEAETQKGAQVDATLTLHNDGEGKPPRYRAAIWGAFFSRCQRYRCGQGRFCCGMLTRWTHRGARSHGPRPSRRCSP